MKPFDLMELMSDLPDTYIESSSEPNSEHRTIRMRYILPAVAACLAVVMLAAIYPKLRVNEPGRVDPPVGSAASIDLTAVDPENSSEKSESVTTSATVPSIGSMTATETTGADGSSATTVTTTAKTSESTGSAAVTTTDGAVIPPQQTTVFRPAGTDATDSPPLTTSRTETTVSVPMEGEAGAGPSENYQTERLTVTRRPLSGIEPPGGSEGNPTNTDPQPDAELLTRGGRYYLAINLPYPCRYATVSDAVLERGRGHLSVVVLHSESDPACEQFRIEIDLPEEIFYAIRTVNVTKLRRSTFEQKDDVTLSIY